MSTKTGPTTDQIVVIKNFERLQHYKDRSPKWIKVYVDLLTDYAFAQLSNGNKWIYIGLLLLASRTDNRTPFDGKWLAGQLALGDEGLNLQPLVDAGFVMLADRNIVGECVASKMPHALLFSSLGSKKEKKPSRQKRRDDYSPVFEEAWKRYPARPNNNKPRAWQQWAARLKAGDTELQMLQGTASYAAYIVAEETPPGYIKQAATFFGPNRHYLDDFTPTRPVQKAVAPSRDQRLRKLGFYVPEVAH